MKNSFSFQTMHALLLWVGILLCIPFRLDAESISHRSNELLLGKLDRLIEQKASLHQKKEAELENLKKRLRRTTDAKKRFLYQDTLFCAYLHYQADSALYYLQQKEASMQQMSDQHDAPHLLINRAEVYGLLGMYPDAIRVLRSVPAKKLDQSTLCYYYRTCRACYGWLADFSTERQSKQHYLALTQSYRDSILTVIPDGVERECVFAETLCYEGRVEQALQYLLKYVKEIPEEGDDWSIEQIYLCYTLSEIYDDLGDREHQVHYLALTGLADIRNAIREYASLPKLAYRMYEAEDVNRAYSYLSCALEDATDCNASLRSLEASQIYPIIQKKYQLDERNDRRVFWIVFFSVSVLTLLLLVAVFYLCRWMKKLSGMRRDLSKAYKKLQEANDRLEQTGRIKEAYIARYLDQCVTYLDKLDNYRRSLAKLAMSSRVEELYKSIKSEEFITNERKEFYREFDRSFLNLFPHFVDSFNALLQEEARIQPKSGEMLTTEFRIFALIRLGITDSSRIAHFLRYSLTTIYNYRSKLRNKAFDKDNFEQQVMNL